MKRRLLRTPCPACGRPTAFTNSGRLHAHGVPRCPRRTLGRIWETSRRGRPIALVPGPDTWSPA